jgi:hypothetical protein
MQDDATAHMAHWSILALREVVGEQVIDRPSPRSP